jgi:nucleoside-diphosphate-sugar epimerase
LLPPQDEKLPLIVNIASNLPLKIAITGANGWVGKKLVTLLQSNNCDVVCVPRAHLSDIGLLQTTLQGCQSVVHLAALVHQMREPPTLAQFRSVNCVLTINVAKAAAAVQVKQLIFVSTAKVMGEQSTTPFKETDAADPQDDYSRAKWEAEITLKTLQDEGKLGALKVCVLRPPLIYGEGVGANFAKLERLAASSWPLPLGTATALRSMIQVDDFNSTILKVFEKRTSLPSYEVFFVSDKDDKSTASIIAQIRTVNRAPTRLVNVRRL